MLLEPWTWSQFRYGAMHCPLAFSSFFFLLELAGVGAESQACETNDWRLDLSIVLETRALRSVRGGRYGAFCFSHTGLSPTTPRAPDPWAHTLSLLIAPPTTSPLSCVLYTPRLCASKPAKACIRTVFRRAVSSFYTIDTRAGNYCLGAPDSPHHQNERGGRGCGRSEVPPNVSAL